MTLQLAVLEADTELSDSQRALLERMGVVIERLTTLIVSLLHRTSIESGQMDIEMERFEPVEVGREVAEDLRPEVEQSGLELRTAFDEDLDEIVSDRRLVRLILSNPMNNALKYTDAGHIELSISRDEGDYRFSVTDTGPGIAPQERVRLFEPFERGADARERALPGVGLGLALVRDFSEAIERCPASRSCQIESRANLRTARRTKRPILPDRGGITHIGTTPTPGFEIFGG
ncbi:MAG: sensor histidine kinase [Persicimonas sp.]